ncbi:hypothetical protein PDESU_01993 [Pontiella desulfatans]|uniref:Sialidase domain-containing protein n=1 Tax=Pontiella desulfatans TaxID=2750659 RepID=A0A6C2U226_PONDE|nr:BNR-4 repeat-containing protein [Pontiella desulfatans]VGO13436.1 hypothetical protein PDESU_01993 [Pontiella desulfatans]
MVRKQRFVRFNIFSVIAVGLFITQPGSSLAAESDVEYFTDNGYGNPTATMQHPSGEYFEGTTYVAYQGPHEDPYVCSYEHSAKKWAGPYQAGVNLMGQEYDAITREGKVDNHGRPSMIIDAKGYIHLAFGGHGGVPSLGENSQGAQGRGKQTHVVSKRPRDITEWEELENISPFGTYSQWVKMPNGDLYLFFRHGSHQSDWVYQKSTDAGRTFTSPKSVLKSKPHTGYEGPHDAWYVWFAPGKDNTITASYVYHLCDKSGAGRHTNARYNYYYMMMNTDDGSWQNIQGQKLDIPVTKEVADKSTMIVDTNKERANHGTCRVDENGNPHLFFRHDDGHVRYIRWLGDSWQKPVRVVPGNRIQDGDILVDSPLNVRLLLSHKVAGAGTVGYWRTTDGGLTWKKDKPLITSKKANFKYVSSLMHNANPEALLLLSEHIYGQEHQYRKMILLGDNGPVTRPEKQASNLGDRLQELQKLKAEGKLDDQPKGRRGRTTPRE